MAEPWFDPNTFGAWFGSIVGGGMGTLCGLLGAAAALAPRGKARRLIMGAWYLMLTAAIALLIAGVYAFFAGQPYGIWYGPLLSGVCLTTAMGGLLPLIKMRYRQAEERRIEAEGLRMA